MKLYRPPVATNFSRAAWDNPLIGETTGPWAYALNMPQIGEAKPGHISMKPCMDGALYYGTAYPQTREDLQKRLDNDGLVYFGDMLPERGHVMAFFANSSNKHSFNEAVIARRDSNNLWSVKASGGCGSPFFPQQTDFKDRPIADPRTADFGHFTDFLGFAAIPYDGILYYRRVVLPESLMTPFRRVVPAAVKLGLHTVPA